MIKSLMTVIATGAAIIFANGGVAAEPAKDAAKAATPAAAPAAKPSPALEAKFRKISPGAIPENLIKTIGSEWMLITAGTPEKFNSMTAGWGGTGVMWSKPVAFILVRNTRYTFGFLEREPYFTLTFFDKKYKPQLLMFGTKSGRKVDKLKESGFTPVNTGNAMAYEEARMIIVCKKIYGDKIKEECATPDQAKAWYFNGSKDYHKLYFGEITAVWVKK